MRIDNLFQFIVPLTFLAIWALTSLLNREAQPLPPRAGPRPNPPGPRPGGLPMPPRPPERRPEPLPRNVNARWPNPTPTRRTDEDVLIIESEPRRTPANLGSPARPGAVPIAPRRTARSRSAPPPAKRPEPAPPPRSTLSMSMGTLTHPLARLQEIDLRKDTHVPNVPAEGQDLTKLAANDPPRTMFRTDTIGLDARATLVSPTRLREALILNEILRPPLSVRHFRER